MLSLLLGGPVGRGAGLSALDLTGQRFVLISGDWRLFEIWSHR